VRLRPGARLSALAILVFCVGAAPLPPGDHDVALTHGGRERSYIVHVPPTTGAPLPVVLSFHGAGANGHAQQGWVGLDRLADQDGFLAVYPNGTGRFGRFLFWNAGTCCGYAQDNDVDDVGFTRALLDDLATRVPVDATRVYATGMSNGAMMSYRLALEASDRIAAIAPVGGGMLVASPHAPPRPVPVMHFHSVDDPRAIYGGGVGPLFPFFRRVRHPNIEQVVGEWARYDGCPSESRVVATRRDGEHTATEIVYGPCREGSEVVLWKLTGAGHVWPGADARYPRWFLGTPTKVVDASEEMWRFFRRFTRPDAPALAPSGRD